MRQVKYQDGTPSREIEEDEDWETTGNEEMNRLHAGCKRNASIMNVRDKLNNLRDLVDVCGAALLNEESKGQPGIHNHVAHVLYFFVDEQLANLEKELTNI